ncbi:hypothetical protein [Chamaesiphon sp. VAR_48_metabat_403]|nr:hypothetical protein [Chamaesiphon sp. VAR_48_metabat_403]
MTSGDTCPHIKLPIGIPGRIARSVSGDRKSGVTGVGETTHNHQQINY